jgi:lipopolysaccharide export system permease protein
MCWGYRGVQKLVLESVGEIAYRTLEMHHSFTTRTFSVHVKDVKDRKLIHATFSFQAREGAAASTVTADEAELRTDPDSGTLGLVFRDGCVESETTKITFPGAIEYQIALDQMTRKGDDSMTPAHIPLAELGDRISSQQETIRALQTSLAATCGFAMILGEFHYLGSKEMIVASQRLDAQRNLLTRLSLETPRRISNGFSCLCFALVGVPMAIRRKNAEFLSSFFVCFLPILLVYYPLLMLTLDRAKSGAWPSWCLWAPNLVMVAWSLVLFPRAIRY